MANTYLEDRALRALDNLSALNTLANPQEPNYWGETQASVRRNGDAGANGKSS